MFDSVENFFDSYAVKNGKSRSVAIWPTFAPLPIGYELTPTDSKPVGNLALAVSSLFSELFQCVHCVHRIHLMHNLVNNMFTLAYWECANA